jgi:ADP-ribose pyrophosphatase
VLYLANGLTAGDADPDETEELEVRWMDFAEAVEAVRTGALFDSMTQIGLLHVALDRADGSLTT